jgi:hypothetical protein
VSATEQEPEGIAVLVTHPDYGLMWHHSTDFDGCTHETACGRSVDCDEVRDTERDVREHMEGIASRGDCCIRCEEALGIEVSES